MRDFLLRFDSKEQAVDFALENGYATNDVDDEGNEVFQPLLEGEQYSYVIIGENISPSGETETLRDENGDEWEQPIMVSDNKHWILFRSLDESIDTTIAEDYIVWDSESGDPRPEDAPRIDFF